MKMKEGMCKYARCIKTKIMQIARKLYIYIYMHSRVCKDLAIIRSCNRASVHVYILRYNGTFIIFFFFFAPLSRSFSLFPSIHLSIFPREDISAYDFHAGWKTFFHHRRHQWLRIVYDITGRRIWERKKVWGGKKGKTENIENTKIMDRARWWGDEGKMRRGEGGEREDGEVKEG